MAEPTPTSPATSGSILSIAHPDAQALRIVLFGMPDAGKSSLLGALTQASQTQPQQLRGKIIDLTSGLLELWRRVYEDRPRETLDEIVPYPAYYERFISSTPTGPTRSPLMLYDCDGRIANEILSQRRPLQRQAGSFSLAQAVLDADALILAVDASASNQQVERDFQEFLRFLHVLQSHRSHDRAVGGLPVYLVLTKCDLLARDGIDEAEWNQRIMERKQNVAEMFRTFLDRSGTMARDSLTFGSLDFHVCATAVRHPELKNVPPQPRIPLGVAELFADCILHAETFRDRVQRADRRLKWTVALIGSLLGLLAIGALLLFLLGGPGEVGLTLREKVQKFRAIEGPPAVRLSRAQLERRQQELSTFRDDAGFRELDTDQQAFVRQALDEIQAYQQWREKLEKTTAVQKYRELKAATTATPLVTSRDDLIRWKAQLENDVPIPTAYRKEWDIAKDAPEAVLERREILSHLNKIDEACEQLLWFYQARLNEGKDLYFKWPLNAEWEREVADLLQRSKQLPIPRNERPASVAFSLDEVKKAESNWESFADRLQRYHDLAVAIGMCGNLLPAPFSVSISPNNTDINSFAAARLRELRSSFSGYASWSLNDVPDANRPRFKEKIQTAIDQCDRESQRAILKRFLEGNPTGPEKADDWSRIADWLLSPALQEWRQYTHQLRRLVNPDAEDPIREAAMFLRKKTFLFEIRALEIRIPDSIRDNRLLPGEEFRLHYQSVGDGSALITLPLKLDGNGRRDGSSTLYRYTPQGDRKMSFTLSPGDLFFADLTLREGNRWWQLTWTRSRSLLYQFERLFREPRLHEPDKAASSGEWARGVSVAIEGSFPKVPALIPPILFEKK